HVRVAGRSSDLDPLASGISGPGKRRQHGAATGRSARERFRVAHDERAVVAELGRLRVPAKVINIETCRLGTTKAPPADRQEHERVAQRGNRALSMETNGSGGSLVQLREKGVLLLARQRPVRVRATFEVALVAQRVQLMGDTTRNGAEELLAHLRPPVPV